ncbi:sensor histidine kinase [Streptomyces fragilis]|uniref:histidine kinase n=1 Tax=Streptomyces fragilis TaxID=67301 RepID=A0ABV2YNU4_9ACTN|nr:histidine kinase [Streptomyces fragilis]
MTNRRRIPELWRRSSVTVRDLPLALLVFGASFVPALYNLGTQLGGMPPRAFDVWAVVAAALQGLSLTVRRRAPAVCLALVSLGFALDQLRGYHLVAGTALPIALLSAGSHLERHRRSTALTLSTAYVLLSLTLHRLGGDEAAEGYVLFYLTLVLACGAGVWLRSTRAAEAERRRRVAEDTLAAERARIARELHDVVTHHVTAMVVQCEAARYLTAAPERLDETLAAVSDTGRRAITDLRHLLDLLDPGHDAGGGAPGDRTPTVGELRTLVEQTREAGQPVEFTEEGASATSTGSAGLVAYRVVQEALTNALKYAHGSRTRVRVRYAAREITVEVSTEGTGSPTASPGGSGRGLDGLRRRVDVLGGDFSAGPRTDGGFTVLARIPAGSPS